MKQYQQFDPITSLDGTEIVTFQRVGGVGEDGEADPMVKMPAADFSGVEKNRLVGLNTQGGTAYTLVIGDIGKLIRMTGSSANVVTIPPNSVAEFPLYTVIHVAQTGTGQTSIAEGSGVTLLKTDTLNVRAQNSWVSMVQLEIDIWILSGDVELT